MAAHQGRWRRLLVNAGVVRCVEPLIAALHQGLTDARDPDGDAEAIQALETVIRAFASELASLASHATLADHATQWSLLLKRWWSKGKDTSSVSEALRRWAPSSTTQGKDAHEHNGRRVPRTLAWEFFQASLAETPMLDGNLTLRQLRVLPAMAMLGGTFQLVCVCGLDRGRLPKKRSEDPLLRDDDVTWLNAQLGVNLPTSSDTAETERRRFFAALSACTDRLWLSYASGELGSQRPNQPGELILAARSAIQGHRATLAELEASVTVTSSPACFHARGGEAIDMVDARVSQAFDAPADAVPGLVKHTVGRRLVAMHLDHARVASHDDALPGPWTGQTEITSTTRPELAGERPLSARQLGSVVDTPGSYFFRQVLGVHPLRQFWDDPGYLRRRVYWVGQIMDRALELEGDLASRLERATQEVVDVASHDTAERHAVAAILMEDLTRLMGAPDGEVKAAEVAGVALDPTLPMRLEGRADYLSQNALVTLETNPTMHRKKGALNFSRALPAVLQGIALKTQGVPVDRVTRFDPASGKSAQIPLNEAEVGAALEAVKDRLEYTALGIWGTPPTALRLATEPDNDRAHALADAAFIGAHEGGIS